MAKKTREERHAERVRKSLNAMGVTNRYGRMVKREERIRKGKYRRLRDSDRSTALWALK